MGTCQDRGGSLKRLPIDQIQDNLTTKMNTGSSLDKARIHESNVIINKILKRRGEQSSLQYSDNS